MAGDAAIRMTATSKIQAAKYEALPRPNVSGPPNREGIPGGPVGGRPWL